MKSTDRSPSTWRRLQGLLGVPAWRPLATALALVLVAVGVRGLIPGPETSGVLRSSTPGTERIGVTAEVVGRAWVLRWEASSGADGHVVTVFDDAFQKLMEIPAPGSELRVDRMQEGLGKAAFFQVVAVSAEEQVATSGPLPLPQPGREPERTR